MSGSIVTESAIEVAALDWLSGLSCTVFHTDLAGIGWARLGRDVKKKRMTDIEPTNA